MRDEQQGSRQAAARPRCGVPGTQAAPAGTRHERFEGVDAEFLDSDTWAEAPRGVACPKCGYVAGSGDIRCPRCNAFLLMGCGGSCASCGSMKCARRA